MSEPISTSHITKINDRLDKICRRRYGSEESAIILFVIAENPGLERQDVLLRPGIKIDLPDLPNSVITPITTKQVYLWT